MTTSAIPDFYAMPASALAPTPAAPVADAQTWMTFMVAVGMRDRVDDAPSDDAFVDPQRLAALSELLDDCRDTLDMWLDDDCDFEDADELL